MLDLVDAIVFAAIFSVALIYIHGCDLLKGSKQ